MLPHVKKLVDTEDYMSVMKPMAQSFCANVETVKCITSMKGDCKPPAGFDLPKEVMQGRDMLHKGLDCICTNCPNALSKILTMTEKQQKGEYTNEEAMLKDTCDMYPDVQCLMTSTNCMDSIKLGLSATGADPSAGGSSPAEFEEWATTMLNQLKQQCESKGLAVTEYKKPGDTSSDVAGAVRMQGASIAAALAIVLAMLN